MRNTALAWDVHRSLRALAPPKLLSDRLRYLFLVYATLNVLSVIPRVTVGDPSPWRLPAVAVAAALAVWWVTGYRKGRLPAVGILVEGAGFLILALALDGYGPTLGLLFPAVTFRCLYGGWRHAAVFCSSILAGAAIGMSLAAPEDLPRFAMQGMGVPVLALFTALLAHNTRKQEAAARRERIFAEVGSALASGPDKSAIVDIAAGAADRMLADVPGAWVAIALPDADVTAVAGSPPPSVSARPIDTAAELTEQQVGSRVPASADLDAEGHATVIMPLQTDTRCYGTLSAGGTGKIPEDIRRSLAALRSQITLGLVNADIAADLRHHALHDALTGLANRKLLHERLAKALTQSATESQLAVLIVDLDGFKEVNDTYGHATGDALLTAVATRLRKAVRATDTVARLGGDEFAVVLDRRQGSEDAVAVALRLLQKVQVPLTVNDKAITPAASVGVAVRQHHGDIFELLHDADKAMYAAKQAGKGCVGYIDATGDSVVINGKDGDGVRPVTSRFRETTRSSAAGREMCG